MCSRKPKKKIPPVTKENLKETLPALYQEKVVPMEKHHEYDQFYSPPLTKAEFDSVPMVMFLGQYSVGKTTMIKYLIGEEYPNSKIGPDPTTDSFTVVNYAKSSHLTMGTTLVADPSKPFGSLAMFGNAFQTRFQGASVKSDMLKHMMLIDTPGILSGEKQVKSRGYDFATVTRFMADKVDMIILMFDTSKLDISDEYKYVMQNLRGNEEKIKIVLNKADMVDQQHLVRVRGALMWMLSKVIQTPEVPKVYVCSFSDRILEEGAQARFNNDYNEIFDEFLKLPARCINRKVNDIIKRTRSVRLHALLMTECMTGWMFANQRNMMKVLKGGRLEVAFKKVKNKERIPPGDMPSIQLFRERGMESYAKGWHRINKVKLADLDQFLKEDIPRVLQVVPTKEDPPEGLKDYFKALRKLCRINKVKKKRTNLKDVTISESTQKSVSSKSTQSAKTKGKDNPVPVPMPALPAKEKNESQSKQKKVEKEKEKDSSSSKSKQNDKKKAEPEEKEKVMKKKTPAIYSERSPEKKDKLKKPANETSNKSKKSGKEVKNKKEDSDSKEDKKSKSGAASAMTGFLKVDSKKSKKDSKKDSKRSKKDSKKSGKANKSKEDKNSEKRSSKDKDRSGKAMDKSGKSKVATLAKKPKKSSRERKDSQKSGKSKHRSVMKDKSKKSKKDRSGRSKKSKRSSRDKKDKSGRSKTKGVAVAKLKRSKREKDRSGKSKKSSKDKSKHHSVMKDKSGKSKKSKRSTKELSTKSGKSKKSKRSKRDKKVRSGKSQKSKRSKKELSKKSQKSGKSKKSKRSSRDKKDKSGKSKAVVKNKSKKSTRSKKDKSKKSKRSLKKKSKAGALKKSKRSKRELPKKSIKSKKSKKSLKSKRSQKSKKSARSKKSKRSHRSKRSKKSKRSHKSKKSRKSKRSHRSKKSKRSHRSKRIARSKRSKMSKVSKMKN